MQYLLLVDTSVALHTTVPLELAAAREAFEMIGRLHRRYIFYSTFFTRQFLNRLLSLRSVACSGDEALLKLEQARDDRTPQTLLKSCSNHERFEEGDGDGDGDGDSNSGQLELDEH